MGGRGHCSKKIPQATFLCVCVSPGMMNNQIKNVSLLQKEKKEQSKSQEV
jgi:hypothetical protein